MWLSLFRYITKPFGTKPMGLLFISLTINHRKPTQMQLLSKSMITVQCSAKNCECGRYVKHIMPLVRACIGLELPNMISEPHCKLPVIKNKTRYFAYLTMTTPRSKELNKMISQCNVFFKRVICQIYQTICYNICLMN